jgi:hypothetical protein
MKGHDRTTTEAAHHGVARSPHWPMAEHHFLREHPICDASGVSKGLQVHHVAPFHFCILVGRVDLEIDPRNFVVLSESEKGLAETNYHLLIGHANDFQSSNLHVREDAKVFYGQSEDAIKSSALWKQRVADRCKPWAAWTTMEKQDFRLTLDALYPLPAGVSPEQQLDALVALLKAKQ